MYHSSASDDYTFYYYTKALISFWYKCELNLKFFIQSLENFPVELTGTHNLSNFNHKNKT